MNRILVISPDKISLNTFTRHLMKYFRDSELGKMHALMSQEAINLYIDDFFQKFKKGIIVFYAKRWINVDPMTRLPNKLKEMDLIVWFDLYSTEPKILKQSEHSDIISSILNDWNTYIQTISK